MFHSGTPLRGKKRWVASDEAQLLLCGVREERKLPEASLGRQHTALLLRMAGIKVS